MTLEEHFYRARDLMLAHGDGEEVRSEDVAKALGFAENESALAMMNVVGAANTIVGGDPPPDEGDSVRLAEAFFADPSGWAMAFFLLAFAMGRSVGLEQMEEAAK